MNPDVKAATNAEQQELAALASDDKKPRKSQADRLVEIAEQVELFHQDIDEPFASFEVANHVETWRVKSAGFKRWLSHAFYLHHKNVPSSQAIQDALNVLAGRANYDGEQIPVHTRVAENNGKLYLDLADPNWRVVEITPGGWSIVQDAPVKFVRHRGMLAIPDPVRGGSIKDLWEFVNVADEDAFALVKAFLVSTLRPNRPFAFMVFTGEQGSGKTSQSIRLKSVVDPNKAPVCALPRDYRDLAISAANTWMLAFDNVSSMPAWVSDALCCLSTGSGFRTRELFSDADEKIFEGKRPVILNGIGDIVTRPDLLDRSIVVNLPVIGEDRRRQEFELISQFETARPRILGALLDAAVVALRNHSSVKLTNLPRMADFTTWAVAAERAHSQTIFLKAYTKSRATLNHVAIDASVIGPSILQLLERSKQWDGVVGELLEALNIIVPDAIRRSKSWPTKPRTLSNELRRIAPNLRADGIEVTFGKHTSKGTPVRLARKSASVSSGPSEHNKPKDLPPDDSSEESKPYRQQSSGSVSQNGQNSFTFNMADDADDTDDVSPTESGVVEVDEDRL